MSQLLWGPVTGWCQISASADRTSYEDSEAVRVTVVIRNVSGGSASYRPFPFAPGVDYRVTFQGRPAELTAFGRKMKDSAEIASEGVRTLEAGEQLVYEILLNRDFDMTIAGVYEFQVFREITEQARNNRLVATSNPLPIEIERGS